MTGAAAGNYTLATTSLSGDIGTITKRRLTTTLTGTVSKVYDGTNTASLGASNFNIDGRVGSDDVTVSPTSGAYDWADVGTGRTVTARDLTLTGAAAGNYTLATISLSGAIELSRRRR